MYNIRVIQMLVTVLVISWAERKNLTALDASPVTLLDSLVQIGGSFTAVERTKQKSAVLYRPRLKTPAEWLMILK